MAFFPPGELTRSHFEITTAGTSALVLASKSLCVGWRGLGWESQVAENPEKAGKFTRRARVAPNLKLPVDSICGALRSQSLYSRPVFIHNCMLVIGGAGISNWTPDWSMTGALTPTQSKRKVTNRLLVPV